MSHTHPCQHCGTPVECYGGLELNPYGFPEVVCPEFHRNDGSTSPGFLCPACARAEEDRHTADLRDNV